MSIVGGGIVQEFIESHKTSSAYTIIVSATTTGTFTVPADVYSINVMCIGGGGAGFGLIPTTTGGQAGGGGGGFAQSTIATSQGTVYSFNIGSGGTPNQTSPLSGGTTFFGANGCTALTCLVRAMGGGIQPGVNPITVQNGGGNTGNGGLPNVGDIIYNGGQGAAGGFTPARAGGGGGGAGTTGIGGNGAQGDGAGSYGIGGVGTSLYGGAGGYGYPLDPNIVNSKTDGPGGDAVVYGGGGGGAGHTGTVPRLGYNGGNGKQGLLIISYSI